MDLGARSTAAGEYRGIMNLCRVLVRGLEAKAAADAAVDRCANIGNLRADVEECRRRASEAGGDPQDVIAARRLGLHYLQRYFYLIAYLGYLDCPVETRQPLFSQWMSERRELRYLLETLELE
ncbi:hypothetical protein H632_c1491p0 [Helicosporidium sp. ATCC 50920]|nr:hypothetical protein H632_c1491p0 [Helicosporidium sp. ATCC 50920]|eukprot:KDD74204.1 hypothetical protein H632_c1491p0 [Helicosporidium sp. ATCC 50920]